MLASMMGLAEVVQILLLRSRTDPNIPNRKGWTPLIYASEKQHTEVVRILLNHSNIDISRRNSDRGWTALIHATAVGSTEIAVRLLLDHPHENENDVWSALDCASQKRRTEVAQMLLDHADTHGQFWTGSPSIALISASRYGHLKIVQMLIKMWSGQRGRHEFRAGPKSQIILTTLHDLPTSPRGLLSITSPHKAMYCHALQPNIRIFYQSDKQAFARIGLADETPRCH